MTRGIWCHRATTRGQVLPTLVLLWVGGWVCLGEGTREVRMGRAGGGASPGAYSPWADCQLPSVKWPCPGRGPGEPRMPGKLFPGV